MAGYIGNKSQTLVDGYSQAAADAEFVNDPNSVITVSGNSVGIGVTNPDTPLVVANGMKTVVSDSGIHNAVRMDNSYASGITAGAAITWQQDGNIKSSIEANTYGSDYMSFKVTGNVERMRIDSAGRVTMPYQPAFKAYAPSNVAISSGWKGVGQLCTATTHNVGNSYNTSNGIFTAPVSGLYTFSVGGWSSSASDGSRYAFCFTVNGGPQSFIGGGNYSLTDSPLSTHTEQVYLNAGDYVTLDNFSAVATTVGGTHLFWWCGTLLG